MKVSILVPVYAVEAYIAECAQSLFGQDYHDLEYIFVDDCSPDNSISVLKEVLTAFPERANQLKIIRHEQNKGVGAARQTAFEHATGEAIMHADSDDMMPPHAVSALVETMQTGNYDIVTGAYTTYENHSEGAVNLPPNMPRERYVSLLLCQNKVKNNLWARLYRRAFLLEQGIDFKLGINYCEDYTVIARAFFTAHFTTTDALVYGYRIDNITSYTHQISRRSLISMVKANAVVIDFYRRNDVEGRYHQALDMGLLNMYRDAMRNGMRANEIATYCSFKPLKRRNRLFLQAMTTWLPLKISDILYRVYRKMWEWC
ncbi:glycosyltransferase [Prevotella salivae]|uniref:glycosyltransferase family 2 protein n=1 Tax=Segatella salivae TaxID=228604 RepID=UPI001C5DCCE8|nr:glycosyltransferase family 2 protein [Segatella salivae]MBW4764691.1 glycosyltransferase [Segatella salivae]